MQHPHRLRICGTSLALAAALLAACESPPPTIPEVHLGAGDFTFTLPDTLAGGLVRIHFSNDGQEDHHAQFIRLNDGVTRAQFDSVFDAVMAAVPTEGEGAYVRLFDVASLAGGPGLTAPGGQAVVTLDLAPGDYILLCFIPSPDGVPHLAKGMRHWLTLTEPPADRPEPPVAAGTVDMADFTFSDWPAVDTGEVVIGVTNSGQEAHEMIIMRLEGVGVEQALEMIAAPPPGGDEAPPGPPPFRFMGGMQGLMPGQRGWVTLDLPPGEYVMVCFIPSPAMEGRPHIELGMVRAFRVG